MIPYCVLIEKPYYVDVSQLVPLSKRIICEFPLKNLCHVPANCE